MIGLKQSLDEQIAVASVTADNQFAQKIAEFCGVATNIDDGFNPRVYGGGEFCPKSEPKIIAGKRVYLVATPSPKGPYAEDSGGPQDLCKRIEIAADSLYRGGKAREVCLVYPDMHYSRQDRGPDDQEEAEKAEKLGKSHVMEGEAFTAMLQAKDLLGKGIIRVITKHLHSDRIFKIWGGAAMGIDEYDIKDWNDTAKAKEMEKKGREIITELDPAPALAHYWKNKSYLSDKIKPDGSNFVLWDPDQGTIPFGDRVQHYLALLGWTNISRVSCDKFREVPNDPTQLKAKIKVWPEGLQLADKYVGFADDGSDSGGTLEVNAEVMRKIKHIKKDENIGSPLGVVIHITHPWLNGMYNRDAQLRIAGIPKLKEITVGNTWPYIEDRRIPKFKKLSTVLRFAKHFSQTILCLEQGMDPNEYFSFETREDIERNIPQLYDIKRSEMWRIQKKSRKTRPIRVNGSWS
ncbi:hypothetical protein KY346_06315 [Candidatus Woesearchaeota archaeon]|nr:hypothetical protein [Candidatus Woesearchaeota archaeon]